MSDETARRIAEKVERGDDARDRAPAFAGPPHPAVDSSFAAATPQPLYEGVPGESDEGDDAATLSEAEHAALDPATIRDCAGEPQNDTGNGQRLLRHFGGEIVNVREMASQREDGWFYWTGQRWERDGGNERALLCAQRTAPRIALEADYLTATPTEAAAIEAGERAASDFKTLATREAEWSDADRKKAIALERAIEAGEDAQAAIENRQKNRRKFSVSCGNGGRLREMLRQAAPHRTIALSDFDTDPYAFNCEDGTLRFVQVPDPECPDPEAVRLTYVARIDPHRPQDLNSKLSPVRYDPDADAPRFLASITRFQPNAAKRRFLQKYIGYAMTGLTGEQCALINYGGGSNWKSTFVEIISRVMGDYAEMLKFESLADVGEVTGAQANPDFARLPGARFVRTTEIEEGVQLRENLIKSLTSGEPWLTRHNFGNFFEFYPSFKMAMSGNSKPGIRGADRGIWRRIHFVVWDVTIGDDERRKMEDVIAELWEEREGILAWMVEGALAYLNEGLKPPPEVVAETAEYREEMDVVGGFINDCVTQVADHYVSAREMFDAFVAWCAHNAFRAWKEQAFARAMTQKGFRRSRVPGVGTRRYDGAVLHDVPVMRARAGSGEPPHPAEDDSP